MGKNTNITIKTIDKITADIDKANIETIISSSNSFIYI